MADKGRQWRSKASPEQLQARLDLRRSNAAQPHKSGKEYKRKPKYGTKEFEQE